MLMIFLVAVMLISLFLEVPMVIGMLGAALAALLIFFPSMDPVFVMQQMVAGVSSFVFLAIPMFILAAEIMCAGECANRLLRLCRAFVGHLPGGLAITASGTCVIFGSISGSTQATFVAVGKPMHRELCSIGYSTPHSLGLLMNSANLALLIPPSIVMIMYAVVTGCSVSDLFLAGVVPGILLFLLIAGYEGVRAKFGKKETIERQPRADRHEIWAAFRGALLPLGFPVIILGGIYSGLFTPTEAAAASVFYASVLEFLVYRTVKLAQLKHILISTGIVLGSVMILTAAGQVFSWLLTFANIPQMLSTNMLSAELGQYAIFGIICLAFFVACMFVDCFPVILIMTPIFYPIAAASGIDAVHLGVVITLMSAIGCITPPFGCNLFTAMAIFDEKFSTVIKGLGPYLIISLLFVAVLIFVPEISLFLPSMAK